MAMGAVKGQESTLQVAMVCLDELVPEDCRYRRLDRLVDWSFVREAASPYYADDVGRPSVDPIVLVKLMVAAALEGIGSTRELCRVASLRLDLRRFLGYGFHERLPVDQTLSHAQTRRFVDGALFERLFLRSLDLCRQHGLVEGSHLSVDGFHAEAYAALASLRASLALVAIDERGEEGAGRGRAAAVFGAAAAFARRVALGSDAEASEFEPDVGLAHRSGREAAWQTGPAAAACLSRTRGGRREGTLRRRLSR
jgi:transposase